MAQLIDAHRISLTKTDAESPGVSHQSLRLTRSTSCSCHVTPLALDDIDLTTNMSPPAGFRPYENASRSATSSTHLL